jgi:hypothetical protein
MIRRTWFSRFLFPWHFRDARCTTVGLRFGNWKFIREDVAGAEAPGFDDSAWTTVSTPHTFNDVDSFRQIISHSGGDRGTYKGLSWYRKHFKLPARYAGQARSSWSSKACARPATFS